MNGAKTLARHQEPDQGHRECEGESVGEALDSHRGLPAPANHSTDKTHDETGDHGTDEQTDAMKPRRVYERMWQDESTHEAQADSEQSELENRERRIRSAEGESDKRHEAEWTMRPWCWRNFLFIATTRPQYSSNALFEDELEQDFENTFENEAEQIFHLVAV